MAGSPSLRPSAAEIATALNSADRKVTEMARLRSAPQIPDRAGSRHYAATTSAGDRLDVTVYDKDQQAAGAVYRLFRSVLLRGQVSRGAPQSADRTVERRALLTYAAEDAGAPTPRLRAVVRVGPEATVLAFDHHEGHHAGRAEADVTDAELRNIWDAVQQLHEHRVTHRSLTADRILLTSDDQVMLLDPGDGDVAASDLQVRLDVAQLLAELALYVGPERAADLALAKGGRGRAGRRGAAAAARGPGPLHPGRAAPPARRPARPAPAAARRRAGRRGDPRPARTDPAPQPRHDGRDRLGRVPARGRARPGEPRARHCGWRTGAGAWWRWPCRPPPTSAAALELSGFVAEPLRFTRTVLAQLAGSFVTLVTPAAFGGAAINIRYLQRRKIPAPVAAASVGVSQVVAFVLHILMLIVFIAIAGAADKQPLRPPTWVYFVLAGLVVAASAVFLVPAGRRLLRARVAPTLGQVLPRLLEVAQQPLKLIEGIGGALLLTVTYILCLSACVQAFGGRVAIAGIAVVYLTGSALGSIVPTPGGLGAVEAALTAGLAAAGMHGTEAASAVLLFRLLTFWLPVPFGWVALNYLERKDAI